MRYYTLEEWRRRKNAGLGEDDYELEESDLIKAYDEIMRTPGLFASIGIKFPIRKLLKELSENAE